MEIEALWNRNAFRHRESVLGDERGAAFRCAAIALAAIGPGAGLAEAALFTLNDDVGRQKSDQVGGIFDQPTRALMQA